ncbi:MAG TPA: threonine/serine dehydratase [Thermomicrobiaceae bacterium]|nr:threonine/serine dehydratase [Thermomicrobiaceae bacterium]
MALVPPTLQDVLRAREVVRRYLEPTPVVTRPALDERLGFQAYLKCENLQPIGAFKLRGGIYLMSRLSPAERAAGVVTASTGNHGQSIAYAARLFGVRAVVYAPEGANPDKVAAMRRLGAELVLTGRDFDEARLAAEERAAREGMRHIHSANEPDLIAGVGTYALELIEQVPGLDAVIVPIGAGSGVCGTLTVMKAVNPAIRVIGVQTEQLPVVERSWRAGRLVELSEGSTFADGLATRVAFELPLRIIAESIDDIRLVSEEAMCRAIVALLEDAKLVAEGAGAASVAAAMALGPELAGRKVGLIISGGNITFETLQWAIGVGRGTAKEAEGGRV